MKKPLVMLALIAAPLGVHAGGLAEAVTETPAIVPAAPAPAPQPAWGGFYAGVDGLYVDGTVSVVGSGTEAFDFAGPMAGIHLGYRHAFGKLVAGAELGAAFGDQVWSLASNGEPVDFATKSMIRGVVSLGYDLDPLLVYALGGVVGMTVEDTTGLAGADPEGATGTVYGLGAAYAISDSFSARFEYHVMDFDPFTGDDSYESDATALMAGLSYSF